MKTSVLHAMFLGLLILLLSPPAGDASSGSQLSRTSPQTATENHNVMLRVVRVTPEWMPYASTGGWTEAVSVKESDVLKFYEAAIWEETSSVHLYAFSNSYDAGYGNQPGVTVTDEQKIAHREQFLIRKYTDMPAAWTEERSVFLKSAFVDMASYLVNQHPDSDHHLMYSGHGGPGGKLFAAQLYENHANEFLKSWTQTLGRPLGVIDMGGPCTKGSFSDLDNFAEYATYYVASDLPNGGYTMDHWNYEKYQETDPETQYHNLVSTNESLEDALKGRIDLRRKRYEYSRNNMITNEVAQANYLYSCAAFRTFSPDFKTFLGSAHTSYSIHDDLYQYMIDNGAPSTLIAQFTSVIVHKADNKDFFAWSEVRNGISMPRPEVTPPVSTVTPLSERTPQVRDAIVTEARLASFYSLALDSWNITSLKAGDFDGLTSLTTLSLSNNQLGTLPAGIFNGLTSLTSLDLSSNQLSALPADIFDGLTSLATLNLWSNPLNTLPEGLFEGLTSLTTLNLGYNHLNNLPAGIFVGLAEPQSLHLYGNATDPLPLPVSIEKIADGQFKAVAPTGAPFNIVLPLIVTNGTIGGGAAGSVTISTGTAESPPFTVARTPGTTAAVTVNIGTLPGLPTEVNRFNIPLHQGYTLVKSGDLPLAIIAAAAAATDFNGDGRTDFVDFFLFADAYGGTDARFDLDGSGTVDFVDFFKFVDAFDQPGQAKLLALAQEMFGLPTGLELQQNAPNPFNSETVISYSLSKPAFSRIEVFALNGQRVSVLAQGPQQAGRHRLHWDGRDDDGRPLGSGVYLYRLVTGESVLTRKLTLLR